jgi:hypothetical protein
VKRFVLFIFSTVLFALNSYAQVPDTLWSKIYNISPDLDDAKCIDETEDGGYIVTGSTVPNGMTSAIDIFLLKTNANGDLIWIKTYGWDYIEEGLSVEQTVDGGYIIGGRALHINGPIPASDNHSDVWILKTDRNGDTLWTKSYGGTGHDYCTSIHQTLDLGYIISGTKNSKYAYPPNCFLDCSDYYASRAWLVRTDANGDTLWTKYFDEGSYGNFVRQTSDGGLILVGSLVFGNQLDILLVKTNLLGELIWKKVIGGNESLEFGRDVREVSDGFVITGHGGPLQGAVDVLLMKTDISGEVLWTKTFGGEMSDSGNSLELMADGGFIVTGIKNAQWYIHYGDVLVFETDSEGNLIWERVYDIRLNDYAWSSAQTRSGRIIITGMVAGTGIGDGDVWVAKMGTEPSHIPDNQSNVADYILYQNYPNPFNPITTIEFSLPRIEFVTLKIYNILGWEVATLVSKKLAAGNYKYKWDAGSLSSGLYLYKIKAGAFQQTEKMVLLR